jgi:hypothetical protein
MASIWFSLRIDDLVLERMPSAPTTTSAVSCVPFLSTTTGRWPSSCTVSTKLLRRLSTPSCSACSETPLIIRAVY